MSKWLRGRLGRPIAGIISAMLLVTILLPLAPPPARAQEGTTDTTGTNEWSLLSEVNAPEPVPLAVLDFNNRSGYVSGTISREMADSLTLALEATGEFSVVDRDQVNAAMRARGFTVPLSYEAQAMLADHLNVPFVITGEIERITPVRTKEGTYVEAVINAIVVSRVTRLPINGARITQKSSPKLGYTTSVDPLIQEAISTGAYAVCRAIQDNRMPVATVLNNTDNGVLRIRGGSIIGVRTGMQLVAVRHGGVTGLLRADKVSPIETTCTVLHDTRGVAPSDKVVPVFSLEPITASREIRQERSVAKLLPFAAAGVLAALVKHSGNSATPATSVAASPIADAVAFSESASGANLITWRKKSKEVLKMIIYRVVGSATQPIAVVDAAEGKYLDNAYAPVTENSPRATDGSFTTTTTYHGYTGTYELTINEDTPGPVIEKDGYTDYTTETWARTVEHAADGSVTITVDDTPDTLLGGADIEVATQTATITIANLPLKPGESASYRVQPIYYLYDPSAGTGGTTGSGISYQLRLGEMSAMTDLITLTAPPRLVNPAAGDTVISGTFDCIAPNAASGVLQISGNPLFSDNIDPIPAQPATYTVTELDANGNTITHAVSVLEAIYPLENILAEPKLASATTVYVRMGVKYPTNPKATVRQLSWFKSDGGYVFSEARAFSLTRSKLVQLRSPSSVGPVWPGKGATGRTTTEPGAGRFRFFGR